MGGRQGWRREGGDEREGGERELGERGAGEREGGERGGGERGAHVDLRISSISFRSMRLSSRKEIEPEPSLSKESKSPSTSVGMQF